MGVMDVEFGKIHWDGNKFALASSRVRGVIINGSAILDGGRIKQVDLLYNKYAYQVLYHYGHPLDLAFVPHSFEVSSLPDQGLRYAFEILSFETSPELLPAAFFEPAPTDKYVVVDGVAESLHAGVERHWIYSNNVAFHVWENGQLVPVPGRFK
jgi:hypothetical protein